MSGKSTWDRLFEAPPFFLRYKHFIVLLVSSNSAEDQLEWCGLVTSKLRILIGKYHLFFVFVEFYLFSRILNVFVCLGNLERNQHIMIAHVHPDMFNCLPPTVENGYPSSVSACKYIVSKIVQFYCSQCY